MPTAGVTFDMSEVEAQLDRVGRRAKNFDNALLTTLLLEHVEEVFESEGRAGADGPWQPLSPDTIERHPSRSSGALLFNTGVFSNWQSATQGETSIVWSPAPYAKYHVTGTENMPKRNPFAVIESKFMDQAERIMSLEIGR